jgi:hypothetical protein
MDDVCGEALCVACDVLSRVRSGNLAWADMFVEWFWRWLDTKVCRKGGIRREDGEQYSSNQAIVSGS